MNRLALWVVAWLMVWCSAWCCGQEANPSALPPPLPELEEIHPLQEAILPLLVPVVMSNVHELKAMVRTAEFQNMRERWGDQYAVDYAFRRVEQLCWNNRGVTLFVMFLGMIDHRNVGFRVPFLGPVLWLPLSGEFADEFDERLRALPVHLFPDSPPTADGDRDKMQHFFGSAFLAYLFGGSAPAQRVGDFVEWGEDAFVVGGTYDQRDLEANERGRRFAENLREDRLALPSGEMKLPLGVVRIPQGSGQ
jgi:hypothetical protein